MFYYYWFLDFIHCLLSPLYPGVLCSEYVITNQAQKHRKYYRTKK
jgi:hypothetical protein